MLDALALLRESGTIIPLLPAVVVVLWSYGVRSAHRYQCRCLSVDA